MQGLLFYVGASALLGGMVVGMISTVSIAVVLFVCVLAFSVMLVCVRFGHMRIAAATLIAASAFSIGLVRNLFVAPVHHAVLEQLVGKTIEMTGTVVQEPDERETATRLTVAVTSLTYNGVQEPAAGRVLAIVPVHSVVQFGDTVVVRGTLAYPEPFATDTNRVFEYPAYLAVSGVGYLLERATIDTREQGGFSLRKTLFATKEWYLDGIARALSEPAAALAGGITVGDKRALGGELSTVFRDAGLIHIVVLSGYNITIIVAFLLGMLTRTGIRTKLIVGGVFIFSFVVMTGGSATGVRAGIMAGLALVALTLDRRYAVTRALIAATVLMALWNPRMLLHDPGFQLSVVATLGLVHVAPLIAMRLPFVPERFGLREIVASTIGTQIAVLPLIAYTMGALSLVALPVNLLVLPFVPVAMLLSFIAGVLGAVIQPIAVVVGFPALLFLSGIVFIAETAAAIPMASIVVPEISLALLIASYAVLFLIVWRQNALQPSSS